MVVSRDALAVAVVVGSLHLTLAAAPATAQASPLTGWWAGVSPDSGLTNEDGTCTGDVTFVLQEQGGVVTGDLVASTGCPLLRSIEQANNNATYASDVRGSLAGDVVSLAIVRVRTNNGIPNQLLALTGTGTVAANRLTIAASVVGPRTWLDADRDLQPDCDLSSLAANGECGAAVESSATTLSAVRLDVPEFVLDFDTAATGAAIITTPFATPNGTVVASAPGGGQLGLFNAGSGTGSFLNHDQFDETGADAGQLAFDFDVSSITLSYDGFGAGEIVIEVLDANLDIVGSFFDPDTSGDRPGGPITLSAPGIRFLRWHDSDPSRVSSGVDNVSVSVGAATPEDQIDELADAVGDMVAAGVLAGGNAQSLATRVQVARTLVAEDPDGAVGVLNSLVQQIEALVRRGVLGTAEGQALIDALEQVIAALGA